MEIPDIHISCRLLHIRRRLITEEMIGIFTVLFYMVKRLVCRVIQRCKILAVFGSHSNTYGNRGIRIKFTFLQFIAQLFYDASRDLSEFLLIYRAVYIGHKLIAADPARNILFSGMIAQRVREHLQRFITGIVPIVIVDGLKIVHIDHKERAFSAFAETFLHNLRCIITVPQPRQRIFLGFVTDILQLCRERLLGIERTHDLIDTSQKDTGHKRLRQEIDRAFLQTFSFCNCILLGRHKSNRNPPGTLLGPHLLHHFKAVHQRHIDIQQNNIRHRNG